MQLSENPKRLSLVEGTEPSRPNELASLASELSPAKLYSPRSERRGGTSIEGGEGGTRDDYTARYSWGRVLEALEKAQRQQQCKQASKPVRSFVGRFHLPVEKNYPQSRTSYKLAIVDVAARCRG
jgi:hypothetical protein